MSSSTGLHTDRPHWLDSRKWAATTEKKKMQKGLDVIRKKTWNHKTGQGCGANAEVLKSFTSGHRGVFLGGWVGTWMGGIYHYWLIPPIPCSTWHPSYLWHKSWFLYNRSPFCRGGEECTVLSISASPRSSIPHFGSSHWCLIIIRYYWCGICGLPGKACFHKT